jgi:hypothetical protein
MEQVESERGTLITYIPQILLISIIVIELISHFIEGGLAPVTEWKRWAGLLRPWTFVVIALSMVKTEFGNIFAQRKGWVYAAITMGSYILFLILGLSPSDSTLGSLYLPLHDAIYNTGNIAVSAVVALGFLTAFIRVFLIRSALTAMLVALVFISFFNWTPLGNMFSPLLGEIGQWIHVNISAAGDGGWWMATYIGMGALILRVLTGREKLRPQ